MPEMTSKDGAAGVRNEEVVHEYPAVGKYRVRVVRNRSRRAGGTTLDIREYVTSETFEGFTRRGVRLGSPAELLQLQETFSDALERGWFGELPAA